ncbi:O-antigen ligase family protein [Thermus sp.]|uniref:O-antigen ligase family protein n=1 Tax=Thermus sp. TaxID=275 RepID=UPI00307EC3F6
MDALVRKETASPVTGLEKALWFLLLLLAFSLPFDGYNLFGFGSIFRYITPVVLLIFLCLVVLNAKASKRFFSNLFSPISVALLLFVAWSGTTSCWAPNTEWALERVFTYLGLLGVTFAISILSVRFLVRFWLALLLGVVVSLPLGFLLPHPNPWLVESGRFSSGGKDPNDYANLALIGFLVVYFGAMDYLPKVSRLVIHLIGGLSLLVVPLSGSRTALLNAAFNLTLGLIGQGVRGFLILLMIFSLVLGSLFVLRESQFATAFMERISTIGNILDEGTWAGRVDIWRAAWAVFTSYPLTGVGVANFAWISPQYSQAAAQITFFREDGGGGVAHNSFLSVMAETGIAGLTLFVLVQLTVFLHLLRIRRRYPLARGLLLGLLAYWVASLTLTWEYVKVPFFLYGSSLALKEVRNQ